MENKYYNYSKLFKSAPKRFNYIRYIEQSKGELNISRTSTKWPDGETTNFSWYFSTRNLRTDGKTAKEAVMAHYLISKKYEK